MADNETSAGVDSDGRIKKVGSRRLLGKLLLGVAAGALAAAVAVPPVAEHIRREQEILPRLKEPARKPKSPERQPVFGTADFQSLFSRIRNYEETWGTSEQQTALRMIFNLAQDYLLYGSPVSIDYADSPDRTGTQRITVLKKGETYLYLTACCQRPLFMNLKNKDNFLPGFLEVKLVEGNPFSLDSSNVKRIVFSEDENHFLEAETGRLKNKDLLDRVADGSMVDIRCPSPKPLNSNQLLGIRDTFPEAQINTQRAEKAGDYLIKHWGVPPLPINPSRGIQQA